MTTRDSDPITSPSADPRMITDYVTVEEEPMTRTPTKNSETLLPCPFCGSEATIKSRSGSDYGVNQYWVECVSCRSCSHVVSDSEYISGVRGKENGYYLVDYMQSLRSLWNTRAPSDTGSVKAYSDANHHIGVVIGSSEGKTKESAQVVADYLLANPPMTPERGEGQETGIDAILKRLDACNEAGEIEYGSYSELHDMITAYQKRCAENVDAAERFARFEKEADEHWSCLSRQSAVGGDWDGDAALLDTLLYAQGHGISNHAHSPGTPPTEILDDYEQSIPEKSYYRQSLRVIRRALRATSALEHGDWEKELEEKVPGVLERDLIKWWVRRALRAARTPEGEEDHE